MGEFDRDGNLISGEPITVKMLDEVCEAVREERWTEMAKGKRTIFQDGSEKVEIYPEFNEELHTVKPEELPKVHYQSTVIHSGSIDLGEAGEMYEMPMREMSELQKRYYKWKQYAMFMGMGSDPLLTPTERAEYEILKMEFEQKPDEPMTLERAVEILNKHRHNFKPIEEFESQQWQIEQYSGQEPFVWLVRFITEYNGHGARVIQDLTKFEAIAVASALERQQ